jgi:hypothetical protein
VLNRSQEHPVQPGLFFKDRPAESGMVSIIVENT